MKKNILIIDDDLADIKILKSLLTSEILTEFNIYDAKTDEEINNQLKSIKTDCVFLDINLGKSSGFEWLKVLVERNEGPVIMLTGQGDELTAVKSIRLGATDYLPKQKLEYFDLKQTINRAVENWELKNERDNLLGLTAHELRNPLGVILGYSDMLKKYGNIDKEKTELILSNINERAEHLVNVINGVLNFSRIEKGKTKIQKKSVLVNEFVTNIVEKFDLQIFNKEIVLTLDLPESNLTAEFDPERIDEVLSNLIDNAIKYSDKKSEIFIKAFIEKDFLCIEIIDEGQGIEDDELKFIFNLFSNTKVSSKPTEGETQKGISLSICKKIIDKHSGEILVKSESGKGSVFTVKLPLN